MATVFDNIDKSLVQPPDSLSVEEDFLQDEEDAFYDQSVLIEEDESGGAELIFGTDGKPVGEEPDNFFDNLVGFLSDDTLTEISTYVMTSAEDDRNSREEWEQTYSKGLSLLGLKYENRTEPFEGATGVIHPILNEAVTQFQSGAYKELLPSSGPVKVHIVSQPTPELTNQSQRVQDYMNYMLMYKMEEYEPEYDQMLYFLGLAGSAFKKVYFDPDLMRPVSKFIPAEDILVNYAATDLKSAERVTHRISMPENELRRLQLTGFYADVELTGSEDGDEDQITEKYDDLEGVSNDYNDEIYTLLECHCYLDLDEYPDKNPTGETTGLKLPYIVTVCKDTSDVLSVKRNYSPEDVRKAKLPHFVQYKFTPGLGFYGFGLIHLLGNLSRTATANLRQLIDAGTLANMPAGFKSRGLRIADDANPLQPGEFRDVDVPGGDLRASLIPLPYKEPSGTLFQLMGFVVEAAHRFIGTTDIGVGDGNQEMPVGTTIALLERGSRIISAVHKRLHASLKTELKMLGNLFSEDPQGYPYEVGVDRQIMSQDFDDRIDIMPVSDPNIFSMSQRVILAQEQLKLAQAAPELHNLYQAYRNVYEALGVKNIDAILKPEEQRVPKDPSTENQDASGASQGQGQLTAFSEQDHQAHIKVHQAYMQSKVAQMQQPVLLVLEKHIFEHIGLQAQTEVQMQMQQQQQQMDQAQMANLIAQRQAQLMSEYLQQNPPQPDTDPLVEIKKQELQLRSQELAGDQQIDNQKLQLDQQKSQAQTAIARERIDSQEDIANMRAQIAMQRMRN
jgi:hypothetical protein